MSQPEVTLSVEDVLRYIARVVQFPRPTICVNLVGADLLSMLEKKGWSCPEALAAAVVDCEDDRTVQIVEQMFGKADALI